MHSDKELDTTFDTGYADGLERCRQRDEQLRRLAEASEEGPDAVTALAREVGVMPADEVDGDQMLADLERWLREQD
ncbi:hypothetical protein EV384_3779 [Micromonospora kangleipakensis]|uniref:Uncharacterized protein n=1 Tax=Micromonospora kangleipakensis TaxID=1077942 RepID=A0A4Q8BBP2_9ACTN|nr:hypothetical protein [Micromonospora kangleipakensis]RZU75247.1 hypothetical protein EV384_3779 [Micromonospora kangleipakensis]